MGAEGRGQEKEKKRAACAWTSGRYATKESMPPGLGSRVRSLARVQGPGSRVECIRGGTQVLQGVDATGLRSRV
eukprot:1151329-Rhodomonas_salina.1